MAAIIKSFRLELQEISLINNNLPEGEFTFTPEIRRSVGQVDNIPNNYFVDICVDIHDKPECRFPLNLKVRMVGIFEIENGSHDEIDQFLKLQGFQMVFPHVRALVANMASSYLPPILLPIMSANAFEDTIQ